MIKSSSINPINRTGKNRELVLPLTSKSISTNADFSPLPRTNSDKNSHITYEGVKTRILGAIHTHPRSGGSPSLCPGDLSALTSFNGAPLFVITSSNTIDGARQFIGDAGYTNISFRNVSGYYTRDDLLQGTIRLIPYLKDN